MIVKITQENIDKGKRQVFLPAKVKRFIHRFDTGWSVMPFEFELEV